jgi:hypothetical protein
MIKKVPTKNLELPGCGWVTNWKNNGSYIFNQEQFLQMVSINNSLMSHSFKIGDHVQWNSEAGHVSGSITKIHTSDFNYKGYTHHATKDDPQYEIKSDKSDHVAVHKSSALSLIK